MKINKSFKLFAILVLAFSMAFSPAQAKTHTPVVKKALPAAQTVSAKIVSGDGSKSAAVVLPPGFEGRYVVVADSQEYKNLVSQNKDLQKQVEDEKSQLASFQKETEKVQQNQAAALVKEQEHGSSLFSYIHWISWLGGGSMILGAIGLIILCCFFPALIPVVAKWIISFVEAFFKVLVEVAEEIEKLFKALSIKKAAIPATITPPTPIK